MQPSSPNRQVASAQRPSLSVSSPALTFPGTAARRSQFRVLTVAQQGTDTPVTLTTDAPEYFQLASDDRPGFAPTLTLTPPASGVYVHVRYLAANPGRHVGQLLLQTPYDTQAVTLNARSGGLAGLVRPGVRTLALPPAGQTGTSPRWWTSLLVAGLLGSLALAGYVNRCRLAPRFCDETTSVVTAPEPAVPTRSPETPPRTTPASRTTLNASNISPEKHPRSRRYRTRRNAEATDPTAEQPQAEAQPEQTRLSGAATTGAEVTPEPAQERPRSERRSSFRSRRHRATEAVPLEVSELERELNRNPND